MVALEWAKCLLSVPFQVVWWRPYALRITSLHSLGENVIFHPIWENGLKCILIDVSEEESRTFYCFTWVLEFCFVLFFFIAFLSPLPWISNSDLSKF